MDILEYALLKNQGGGSGTDANAVHYITETKTDEQKEIARNNISAQAELTAGSGIDITNNIISIDGTSSIIIYDQRLEDADEWITNGYTKTSAEIPTANLPSICTGNDRWGVLLYISENNENHAGLQQYFPIDGTYKGRIFYRPVTGYSATTPPEFGEWEMVPWISEIQNQLIPEYTEEDEGKVLKIIDGIPAWTTA